MEEGGEGRGERGRVAKVTKDPKVTTLPFCKGRDGEVTRTPAQKSQVIPDRRHRRPLYPSSTQPWENGRFEGWKK